MTRKPSRNALSRRQFLRRAGAVAAAGSAPMFINACTLGRGPRPAPSGRVNMGFIGVGNRGLNLLDDFLADERVQITTLCDVNPKSDGYWDNKTAGRDEGKRIAEAHYAKQTGGSTYTGIETLADFRELLARPEIDAVVIATPDHWHAIQVVAAAEAGKNIYAEKPLSLALCEGRVMADAVARNRVIFQVGSQQRSDRNFRHACELVRNGYIGQLRGAVCGLPAGTPDYSKQGHRTAPEPVPQGFNYQMWLGPAPERPYVPAASHVNWRWVFDYSGGQLTDWCGHHPDIAMWGMGTNETGPVEILNPKAEYAQHPVYNTAVLYSFECLFANGLTLRIGSGEKGGVTFEGSEGWVWVNRGKIDASNKALLDMEIPADKLKLYHSDNHQRNFIDCVYSRTEPIAPIEQAHRSISLAHLGNIAMRLGRPLKWNPDRERFTGDDEANDLLHRPYRGPWKLEGLPSGGRSLAPAAEPAPAGAKVS